MNDFRPLGKPLRKEPEAKPDTLEPVNRQGTVLEGKDGRWQTRIAPSGPRFKPIPTTPPETD